MRCLRSRTRACCAAGPGSRRSSPDHYPLAGALPGVANAYVLACVRGGYTIGPCIGPLVADLILGREPALPLFDPARFAGARCRDVNRPRDARGRVTARIRNRRRSVT